ncbi:MAG: acetyltransferase [Gracilimonas sp.]|uniref:acetyltransferase n=1 Tax=Gracilimonas sp. TaxID=1974203 RepID=UPI0019B60185|nr:acetyltransferase [Gracilimonas sp.]MBD3615055.1 acetyltransferase [Gracilimonas sp.]
MKKTQNIEYAENIRGACIKAAQEGFMDASISGLCAEGAMEAAISAMQSLNLKKILDEEQSS